MEIERKRSQRVLAQHAHTFTIPNQGKQVPSAEIKLFFAALSVEGHSHDYVGGIDLIETLGSRMGFS